MFTLVIPEQEYYDERLGTFLYTKRQVLQLEHSLLSISKWESKWKIPYLKAGETKTPEQAIDYIKCMTITPNVDPMVYYTINEKQMKAINDYINDPMTATVIKDNSKPAYNGKFTTSEEIYWEMVALEIPFECQKWHLNRLITLISICNIKNNPGKKMPKNEVSRNYSKLNAARRKAMNTKG